MTEKALCRIRSITAAGAALFGFWSVWCVWYHQPKDWRGGLILGLWTLGPPIWFAVESWLFGMAHPSGSPAAAEALEGLERGQELAGNFWKGIGALLVALYTLRKPLG